MAIIGSAIGGNDGKGGGSASGAAAGGGGSQSAADGGGQPGVRGTFRKDCGGLFGGGDDDGCENLEATNISCQWDGDHIRMRITFQNNLNAHVTVHVEPRYRLLNAGTHGEGLTNVHDVGVDALSGREWDEDLDPPAGVSGQPRITACVPQLYDLLGVELG